jgi:hypothetical protein
MQIAICVARETSGRSSSSCTALRVYQISGKNGRAGPRGSEITARAPESIGLA